jgi:hypothetical protein
VFIEKVILTFGVYDTILAFNDGNIGRCQVIRRLGMEPARNMVLAMHSIDEERIRCKKSMSDFERKARQSRRNSKRSREDIEDDVDDPAYGAGIA